MRKSSRTVFSSRWSKVKQAMEADIDWQIMALETTNCGQIMRYRKFAPLAQLAEHAAVMYWCSWLT